MPFFEEIDQNSDEELLLQLRQVREAFIGRAAAASRIRGDQNQPQSDQQPNILRQAHDVILNISEFGNIVSPLASNLPNFEENDFGGNSIFFAINILAGCASTLSGIFSVANNKADAALCEKFSQNLKDFVKKTDDFINSSKTSDESLEANLEANRLDYLKSLMNYLRLKRQQENGDYKETIAKFDELSPKHHYDTSSVSRIISGVSLILSSITSYAANMHALVAEKQGKDDEDARILSSTTFALSVISLVSLAVSKCTAKAPKLTQDDRKLLERAVRIIEEENLELEPNTITNHYHVDMAATQSASSISLV